MNIGIILLCNLENPQHAHRFVTKQDVIGKVNPSAANGKLANILTEQKPPTPQRASFSKIRLHGGTDDAGQIADITRRKVIALHKTLNRAQSAPVGKAHQWCDRHLPLKIEPLLSATSKQMEVTTHGPQKALRCCKPACLAVPQHNLVHKVQNIICLISEFGNPEQRMQIAQPAFTLFDVGFDDVARGTKTCVALVPLSEFLLDKVTGPRLGNNGRHSVFQLPI